MAKFKTKYLKGRPNPVRVGRWVVSLTGDYILWERARSLRVARVALKKCPRVQVERWEF